MSRARAAATGYLRSRNRFLDEIWKAGTILNTLLTAINGAISATARLRKNSDAAAGGGL